MLFGEGVFLRGFVVPMLDDLRRAGKFEGGVTVVKPRPKRPGQTTLDDLRRSGGAYSVVLRGLRDGEPVNEERRVDVIRAALDSETQWPDVLAAARDPKLRYIFSNTTEQGLTAKPEDDLDASPPLSFPAKLAALLRERFGHFGNAAAAGVVVLPCELVERNGGRLRGLVLDALTDDASASWVAEHCVFADTLVDRIVVGKPDDSEASLTVAAEPFGLLAIDGPDGLRDELPLHETGVDVVWGDVVPVRERKVRVLNGLHVAMAVLGPPLGLETTREAMEDERLGPFLRAMLREEILPFVAGDRDEVERFAEQTVERMLNPHIRHLLTAIAVGLPEKFVIRLEPSLRRGSATRRGGGTRRLSLVLTVLADAAPASPTLEALLREPTVADAVAQERRELAAAGLVDRLEALTPREVQLA